MRRRVTQTATGKRLMARVKRITKNSGLTEAQIAYRKRRKQTEDYYKREAQLARYRP